MKYILNSSPVRTTNSFRINDIKLDLDFPVKSNFKRLNIVNLDDTKVKVQYKYGLRTRNRIGIDLNDSTDATIFIKETLDKPLILDYKVDNTMLNIKIDLEEKSTANVIIKTYGNSYNVLTITSCTKEKSNLTINYINMNEGKSFVSFVKESFDNATTTHNIYDLTGDVRLYNYEDFTDSSYVNENINSIYITKGSELLDINYYSKLKGICSNTIINVLGCLKDKSIKSFKGTIDFVEGCKKSVGKEREEIISLSPDTISSSLPMLLCHEEDVEGSHGVANGKIDEEELFYLQTRGFSKENATKYLLHAKFEKYTSLIVDEETRKEIENYIGKTI